MSRPEALSDYPVVIELPVLWADQDAFAHVNNTLSFRWFESARIAYFEKKSVADALQKSSIGPILAHINCNFRRQIQYPDTVLIGASVSRLGRTSITMKHLIYSTQQQAAVSDGDSVIVAFDYKSNQSQPLPPTLREAIEKIEGRPLDDA